MTNNNNKKKNKSSNDEKEESSGGGGGSDGETSSGDNNNNNKSSDDSNVNMFAAGERVLAYHGPRIYEAKVQKSERRNKEQRYFVHYLGWNKNWDEWVGADRLLKLTQDNVLKQHSLDNNMGVDINTINTNTKTTSKAGRSTNAKQKNSPDVKPDKDDPKTNAAKGKKRKIDSGIEKTNVADEKLVKIQIPSTLKKQLRDDWESINQQDKLVKLPRSPNVDDILTKYLESKSKRDGIMTDSVGEILKGIRCYFDKVLPVLLLYKKERQQYQDLITDDVSPSTVYGAEHLLRLFVKLPELMAYVNIEEETLTGIQQKLLDFLKFLQKNQSTFFHASYDASRTSEGKGKGKDD